MKLLPAALSLLLFAHVGVPQPSTSSGERPEPRHGHRMVYDAESGRTILFGGRGAANVYLNDTWTWDGEAWRRDGARGPSPRAWFALAYDTDRGVLVLHGGRDSTGSALGDTWERRGPEWKLVSTEGPPARDHHAMTYDPHRRQVVLFGGFANTTRRSLDDTWAWDGEAWTRLATPESPGPRDAHELSYSTGLGEAILFGGMNVHDGETTVWGDTWSWDGARWTRRDSANDVGRTHFGLVDDPSCACLLRFGGGDSERTPVRGTWRLDEGGWRKLAEVGPSARVDHAMAFDRARGRAVLFAGYEPGDEGAVFGDTWEWDGQRWERR